MKRSMTLVLNRDSEVGFWGRAFPLSENYRKAGLCWYVTFANV